MSTLAPEQPGFIDTVLTPPSNRIMDTNPRLDSQGIERNRPRARAILSEKGMYGLDNLPTIPAILASTVADAALSKDETGWRTEVRDGVKKAALDLKSLLDQPDAQQDINSLVARLKTDKQAQLNNLLKAILTNTRSQREAQSRIFKFSDLSPEERETFSVLAAVYLYTDDQSHYIDDGKVVGGQKTKSRMSPKLGDHLSYQLDRRTNELTAQPQVFAGKIDDVRYFAAKSAIQGGELIDLALQTVEALNRQHNYFGVTELEKQDRQKLLQEHVFLSLIVDLDDNPKSHGALYKDSPGAKVLATLHLTGELDRARSVVAFIINNSLDDLPVNLGTFKSQGDEIEAEREFADLERSLPDEREKITQLRALRTQLASVDSGVEQINALLADRWDGRDTQLPNELITFVGNLRSFHTELRRLKAKKVVRPS